MSNVRTALPVKTLRQPGCHIVLPESSSRVGFVFICPGRHEEKAGVPCAGQTGAMLEMALPLLVDALPNIFRSPSRQSYLITNAWPRVEFKTKTGRSVPLKSEVSSAANIEGLYREIESLQYVVACGKLAHHAVSLCQDLFKLEAAVAKASHTSRQALGCPTNANLHSRLKEWARSVTQQF